MSVYLTILVTLIICALWTTMTRSILRSAIGLALVSAVLAVLMFMLGADLAAVFELSVCSGLISVVFISTISLTTPLSWKEILEHMRKRMSRFWFLPLLTITLIIGLSLVNSDWSFPLSPTHQTMDVRNLLWKSRQLDLLGQVIALFTGVIGVIVLFREYKKR